MGKELKGIDTSKHQASKVDYVKYKKSGGSFVYLRVGCGTTKDKCFEKDYKAAVAAGLNVGVYFYTYSTTKDQAFQDATRVLGWLSNRKLDLHVVYDLEDKKQASVNRRNGNATMYNTFKDKIEKAGYKCMLYTGEFFFNNYFDRVMINGDLWIAKYSSKKPSVGRDILVWQHSSSAVNESYYKGPLDQNYMYNGGLVNKPSPNINPYPVPTRTLKKTIVMMKGNDVKWLQWELNEKGLIENGGIDGVFGNKTLAAVKVYQSNRGLVVDGIVGPATRYSLLND